MNIVTFFTKPDCSLCRSAMHVIVKVRQRCPFHLEIVDISASGQESWNERYRNDIPVIHLNGREVFRHRVDEKSLRRRLAEGSGEKPTP